MSTPGLAALAGGASKRGFARKAPGAQQRQPLASAVKQMGAAEKAFVEREKSDDMGLAERAWKMACLPSQSVPEGAWEAFEERALEGCGALRGEEIVRLLHACTVARRRPKRLLARLAEDIPEKLPQFDTNGLCVCLHSYAKMRDREKRLFAAVSRRLLAEENAAELRPVHLASLLYSHARAVLSDTVLNKTAQTRLVSEAGTLSVDDLATTLQAFVTFRIQDRSALAACAQGSVDHANAGASLQPLSTTLYSLHRMKVPCHELGAVLAKRCEALETLDELDAGHLVQLLYGFGDSEWSSAACKLAADSLGKRLHELIGPKVLVQALEAFARATQSGPTLQDLCRRVAGEMVEFSVKDITAAATACQILGPACDESLFEALARQALRKGWRFKPANAQVLFDACDAAGFDHPALGELRSMVAQKQADDHEREKYMAEDHPYEAEGGGDQKLKFWEPGAARHTMHAGDTLHAGAENGDEGKTGKEEPLEDQPFFEEGRLGDRDIAAVASAAKAWGQGQLGKKREREARDANRRPAEATDGAARGSEREFDRQIQHLNSSEGVKQPFQNSWGDERSGPQSGSRSGRPFQKFQNANQNEEEVVIDPEIRKMLKGFHKEVLRPAGISSKGLLATPRDRRDRYTK